uniref:Pseudouridine synthase n=1 Tax=Rhizophora mucronata TaxID=61149 RepID=A0A2P2JHM1_RHIMU
MLSSLSSASCCGRTAPSRKPSHFSACLFSLARILTVRSGSTGDSNSSQRINYGGVRLEENVKTTESGKLRLDSWISSRISGISRARVQYSIKTGLVSVNGKVVHKVSHIVKFGDKVDCTISELQPLRAEPENIPLDIVYEDDHVLVVNKPAHMVVHPAPGNAAGTLVNGILHHCSLPPMAAVSSQEVISDAGDVSDEEELCSGLTDTSIRPGIVHRLDKGTSGLLVVAKVIFAHFDSSASMSWFVRSQN